jgi:hypothetical protein
MSSFIIKHLDLQKIATDTENGKQTVLFFQRFEFLKKLVNGFSSTNIPFSKMKNKKIQGLVKIMGFIHSPITTCRLRMQQEVKKQTIFWKEYFKDPKFFLVVDETEIKFKNY